VSSDLVYPIDSGYYYVARLDNDWVKSKLRMKFNNKIDSIDNKYVVQLETNTGKTILVYNHDGKHWLIDKP
jgi:hypothetical protein